MKHARTRMLVAALAFSGIGSVGAQAVEEDLALAYGDKSFVSIATGARQPVTRAPSVATVITADDIKSIGATDLDQIRGPLILRASELPVLIGYP